MHKVAVYFDPESKRLYKEYFNDGDGKNTGVVPMTLEEAKAFRARKGIDREVPKQPTNAAEKGLLNALTGEKWLTEEEELRRTEGIG